MCYKFAGDEQHVNTVKIWNVIKVEKTPKSLPNCSFFGEPFLGHKIETHPNEFTSAFL